MRPLNHLVGLTKPRGISEFIIGGNMSQRMVTIPFDPVLKPWSIRRVSYNGESGWLRYERRAGTRLSSDSTAVLRMGLDVWSSAEMPIQSDTVYRREEFYFSPGMNCQPTQNGDWLNFHELHGRYQGGDIQSSGPMAMYLRWQTGGPKLVVERKLPTVDANGIITGYQTPVAWEFPTITDGAVAHFVVEYRNHLTNGFLRVWMDGTQIVDYTGQFGNNSLNASSLTIQRGVYPQFRIYQNGQRGGVDRTDTCMAYFKLVSIDQYDIVIPFTPITSTLDGSGTTPNGWNRVQSGGGTMTSTVSGGIWTLDNGTGPTGSNRFVLPLTGVTKDGVKQYRIEVDIGVCTGGAPGYIYLNKNGTSTMDLFNYTDATNSIALYSGTQATLSKTFTVPADASDPHILIQQSGSANRVAPLQEIRVTEVV